MGVVTTSDSTVAGRLTRFLGRVLSRWGVDAEQYHSLLQMLMRLEFRSRIPKNAEQDETSVKSPLRATLILNALLTALFSAAAAVLGHGTFLFSAESIGYGMLLVMMGVLVQYEHVVISPVDYLVLAHRPISSRTFFAAKISNVLGYSLILGASVFFFPSLIGMAVRGSRLYFPLVYLFAAMVCCGFIVGAVAFLYGVVPRWRKRGESFDFVVYLKAGVVFALFSGYFLLPWINSGVIQWAHLEPERVIHSWAVAFPSVWFAALVELLLGNTSREMVLLSIGAMGTFAVLILPLFSYLSLSHSEQLERLISSNNAAPSGHVAKVASMVGAFFFRARAKDEQSAFYSFTTGMLARNRILKFQVLPTVGVVAAMFVTSLLKPDMLADPFLQPRLGGAATLAVASFVYLVSNIAVVLSFSNEYEGSWIFEVAPIAQPANVFKGLTKAITAMCLLPLFLVNLVFFSLFWPIIHALALSTFAFLLGTLMLQLLLLRFRTWPFSLKATAGVRRSVGLAVLFTALVPGLVLMMPNPFLSTLRCVSVLSALLLATISLARINHSKYASVLNQTG